MASAWGDAWSGAWNDSWGIISAPSPPAVIVGAGVIPSGGHPWLGPYPKRRHIWGNYFPEEVVDLIEKVAEKQLEDLALTKRRQEALFRQELRVKAIDFEARYLEALNIERGLLIDLEIAHRLKWIKERRDDEDLLLLIAVAVSI